MEEIINMEKDSRSPLLLVAQPRPWIAISNREHDLMRHAFYNLSEKSCSNDIITELEDKVILDGGYGNGWMLLQTNDSTRSLCLFNIATMEKVQLPPLPSKIHDHAAYSMYIEYITFFVSSNQTNAADFRVIMHDRVRGNSILTCKPGDMNFTEQSVEGLSGCLTSMAMLDGKLYGLVMSKVTLVVCDNINDHMQFREVGMIEDSEMQEWGQCFLVESCGDILLVQRDCDGCSSIQTLNFRVYRADFSILTWVRLENIGKRTLFIQKQRCFFCSTGDLEGVKENCIYTIFERDEAVYVYDIETYRYFSCFLPCPKVHSRRSVLKWMMIPEANNVERHEDQI